MSYEISFRESFIDELTRAPKKVQKAFQKSLDFLREHADSADGNKIKRLKGFKNLWRCRLSDSYRLIYEFHARGDTGTVILAMLGDRKDVYDRIGLGPDGPTFAIIREAPELIEDEVLRRSEQAWLTAPDDELEPEEKEDSVLPTKLTAELLEQWLIPKRFHEALCAVKTEGELLALTEAIPAPVLMRIVNLLWPPGIEKVMQTPVRDADQPDDILKATTNERSLASFLLKLDEDQEAFVNRFRRNRPEGPWLLKGGPGSGKSTLALYCIREIVREHTEALPGISKTPKILLTTFTKSLINASTSLLDELLGPNHQNSVAISTLDSIAYRHVNGAQKELKPIGTTAPGAVDAARTAAMNLHESEGGFPFDAFKDVRFLLQEVDWVIAGRGLDSLDQYLAEDRSGRGRGLTARQRSHVWDFYRELEKGLRAEKKCLFSERQASALQSAKPTYDYVFIDEAQDLKPVAIRLAVRLCKGGRNVFITADGNQSIYGTGMRWKAVADQLQFAGRTNILRRNYRTTREIWEAVSQLAPDTEDTDNETMEVEPVFSGRWPTVYWYENPDDWAGRLNGFVAEAMKEERVGADSVAVLCPTGKQIVDVVAALDARFNPKGFVAQDLDIKHPGVKVTTIHAAKGIEFPIVVVAGAEDGILPWPAFGSDDEEHEPRQRRLLFVACTRAMRQLLILASSHRPSPFLKNITDDFWAIEGVAPG